MKSNNDYWKEWWELQSNKASSDYEADRVTDFQNKELEKISFDEFISFVDPRPEDIVFDGGCGTGVDLSKLSKHVKKIVGMDLSEGMIERCKKRQQNEKMLNATLLVGRISNLPIKDKIFNKIICMSVLQYLNDQECENALRELVRVSVNGAILVFHVKNLCSLYLYSLYLVKKLKAIFTSKPILVYYRSYRWYNNKLSNLGLEVLDYNSVNKFGLDFLPKFIARPILKLEAICYKHKIFRRFGADFKIRAKKLVHCVTK